MDGRKNNRQIARETLQIIENGFYTVDGTRINFTYEKNYLETVYCLSPDLIDDLIEDDIYEHEQRLSSCEYRVVNMDAYEANYKYAVSDRALVMNFANAYCPGGGFLNGASAQEESLCRCSTLYASIGSKMASQMYDYNAECEEFDTDYILISPFVTVFRTASGELRTEPFDTAVVTVPAVNLHRVPKHADKKRIPAIMEYRIESMFCGAIQYDYDTLILGAWGCGAFGHDAKDVAGYFMDVLVNMEYYKYFKKVIFAVYDTTAEQYNYHTFLEAFGEYGKWGNTDK